MEADWESLLKAPDLSYKVLFWDSLLAFMSQEKEEDTCAIVCQFLYHGISTAFSNTSYFLVVMTIIYNM
jgi:hypothetical protein